MMRIHHDTLFSTRRYFFVEILFLTTFIFCYSIAFAQNPQVDVKVLDLNRTTERKIIGQQVHGYKIELKKGQVLRVNIQEKGADVIAYISRLENPTEKIVSSLSASGAGFMKESATAIADQDSVYALVIRAVQTDSEVPAGYEFTATVKNSSNLDDTLRIDAEKLLMEANQIAGNNDVEKIPLAITKLERCIKLWQAVGDTYWEAITKMSIGSLALKTNDAAKAETYLLQALNLLDKVKNKSEVGNIYAGLGGVYHLKKDEAKAKTYIDSALEIFRNIGDKRSEKIYSTMNLRNLADLETDNSGIKLNDYQAEISAARSKNDKAKEVEVWAKIVILYGLEADGEKSQGLYERVEREGLPLARQLKNRSAEMQMLIGLGIGYSDLADSSKNEVNANTASATSKKYLIQGLVLSKILNDQLFEAFSYAGLATMYLGEKEKLGIFFGKKFINSIHSFRQSLKNLADKETQQALSKQIESLYEMLAVELVEEERLPEAIQVINFSRDQEFFDFKIVDNKPIEKLSLTVNESENNPTFDKLINSITVNYSMTSDINSPTLTTQVKSVFDNLEKNFDDEEKSEQDIVRNIQEVSDMQFALRELSAKTDKNHATIYYFKADDGVNEILLITPQNISSFSENMSDADILEFFEILDDPNLDPRPIGAKIYRNIFKARIEIGEEIGNSNLQAELEKYQINVIHWSLSGKIRYIPLAALYDQDRKQYLVEQYESVIFTRAKKDSFLLPPQNWTQGVGFGTSLAYGDFSALPAVPKELNGIFGNSAINQPARFNGQIFLNQSFTRQSLLGIRQLRPSFVHIASHFAFKPGDAGKSFLLLGDGSYFSLLDMQLNNDLFVGVDLLTLSACQTAAQQSDDATGKEIDGFAELAQRLGAKSVIASLWKVKDPATSELMIEFYRIRQENPNASKSEVLRLAQLTLLNGKSSWKDGLERRSRGLRNQVNGANNAKVRIPFKASPESPWEHPHYWASFVLYGGANGGKTTKIYDIPKPTANIVANNSVNPSFENPLPTESNVTLKQIESSFKSNLFDETIRLSRIFLQTNPNDKDANAFLGYALMLKRDTENALIYLEKAIMLGQPIPFNVKRLREPIIGHGLDNVSIVVSNNNVTIVSGNTNYQTNFSQLSEYSLLNYNNQCNVVHLKGMFTESSTKSEKTKQEIKQFNLFPFHSTLVPRQQGNMQVNFATCNSQEEHIISTIVKLIFRLESK